MNIPDDAELLPRVPANLNVHQPPVEDQVELHQPPVEGQVVVYQHPIEVVVHQPPAEVDVQHLAAEDIEREIIDNDVDLLSLSVEIDDEDYLSSTEATAESKAEPNQSAAEKEIEEYLSSDDSKVDKVHQAIV